MDKALEAVSKEMELDRVMTTYDFRLHYVERQIESCREHDGLVDWSRVRQLTLHFDVKTLKSCYQRLGAPTVYSAM